MGNKPLILKTQGQFPIGGKVIQRQGTFDPDKFISWNTQDQAGQTYHCDHAYVKFQIPENQNKYPLVFVHGYGGDGVCWECTPDGREGFATLLLREGFPTYVIDLPGRGHASRTSKDAHISPNADEQFWFDIWRMGLWPEWSEGSQFPKDSLGDFFREMVPDLSDDREDVPALCALAKKIGEHVLVTHSAGAVPGWFAAAINPEVKGVVALEPGAFVFPKSDLPPSIPCLTGDLPAIPVEDAQFAELCSKPIVIYYGDYIPTSGATTLGGSNWQARLQMAKIFVEYVKKMGGDIELVMLPDLGIKGNSHFLFQELNNSDIADLVAKWLDSKNLILE